MIVSRATKPDLVVCTDRGPLKKRREPKPDSPAETEYSPAAGATKVRTSFNSASASEEDDLLPAASATTVVVKQECTDVEVSRANTIASVRILAFFMQQKYVALKNTPEPFRGARKLNEGLHRKCDCLRLRS